MSDDTDTRREAGRERSAAYRERRREGMIMARVPVRPDHLAALERLALLTVGDRRDGAVAWAVWRYLDSAPHLARMGDALWPERDE